MTQPPPAPPAASDATPDAAPSAHTERQAQSALIDAVSVVVPVHDEAGNIRPLIAEIATTLADTTHEIIYVDDASRDDSLAELDRCVEEFPTLRVLVNDRQAGQSTSVLNGVRSARYDWVAMLDGDGQNDPADIRKLIGALQADTGARMAIGHRQQRRDTWLRRRASAVAKGARRWLLGDEVPDSGCGLKLLRREDYLSLPYFDHMHRFLPTLIQQSGGRVLSVPVNHRARERGRSKYGIIDRALDGIVDLFGVAWLGRRNRHTQWQERRR